MMLMPDVATMRAAHALVTRNMLRRFSETILVFATVGSRGSCRVLTWLKKLASP